MTRVDLPGCRLEPLGSYLKALGVMRLVAEQCDPEVRGWWDGGSFHLDGVSDADSLVGFLVEDYRPTPLVAPWNGGSGFWPKDNTSGIDPISRSELDRLAGYRAAIETCQRLVDDARWSTLDKREQVLWCRSVLSDEALRWLDAAVVITTDSRVFPPIVGTGGNVGRLEYSNVFMQRLVDVLALTEGRGKPTAVTSAAWLRASLFDEGAPRLVGGPIGQFDPFAAGGVNSAPSGAADSTMNPWDYVLMLEGAVCFASGVARRMGENPHGFAAMPFMVAGTAAGYGSSADESSKGELWAPVWHDPTGYGSLTRLLAEGRASWRGSQARTGLDAARAVASLGVDRGIDSFVRHAFVERHGQSILAVPIGRVEVRERDGVPALASIDGWTRFLRGSDVPSNARSQLRELDRAQFDFARTGERRALQDALIALAALERSVAASRRLRELVRDRAVNLDLAEGWLDEAGRPRFVDDSVEARLAAALTSLSDPWSVMGSRGRSAVELLRPVVPASSRTQRQAFALDEHGGRIGDFASWSPGRLLGTLAVERRLQAEAEEIGTVSGWLSLAPAVGGCVLGSRSGFEVSAADMAVLMDPSRPAGFDGGRLVSLVAGFAMFRPSPARFEVSRDDVVLPPLAALLTLFAVARPIEVHFADRTRRTVALVPGRDWPALLQAGRGAAVAADAVKRLRVAGLRPGVSSPEGLVRGLTPENIRRSAAALLLRPSPHLVSSAMRQLVPEVRRTQSAIGTPPGGLSSTQDSEA